MNEQPSQRMQNFKTYRYYITKLQPAYGFLISLFGGLLRVIVIPVVFVLNHQGQSIKMFLFGHMENLFYVYTTADHKIIEFVTYHYNYPSAGKPYYQFTDEETHEYDEKELFDSTDYRIYWDRVEIRKNADKKVRRPIKRQVFPSASLNFTGIN